MLLCQGSVVSGWMLKLAACTRQIMSILYLRTLPVQPGQPTGFFDNNGGLDYHIAVANPAVNGAVSSPGSLSVQAPLKVGKRSVWCAC